MKQVCNSGKKIIKFMHKQDSRYCQTFYLILFFT